MRKLHIPHPLFTPCDGKPTFVPWCMSFSAVDMAKSGEDVTCKSCIRIRKSTVKKAAKLFKGKLIEKRTRSESKPGNKNERKVPRAKVSEDFG